MTALRTRDGVAVIEDGETVYAAVLPDGPIAVLQEIAAVIWDAARRVDRSAIAEEVAMATGTETAAVRPEVDAFVAELIERGLLETVPG